jgi:hypothetical protein
MDNLELWGDSGLRKLLPMRLKICIYFLVLVSFFALGGHAQQASLRFSGRVARGEKFQKDISDELLFVLQPTASDPGAIEGWTIQVSPKGEHLRECDDFVWVVMAPYRGYNDRFLDTSYGTKAEDAVKRSPREFNFVLNCTDYKVEAGRVNRVLWPYNYTEAEVQQAQEKLATSPQGKGRLWIRGYGTGPAPKKAGDENLGQIDWISFDVEIELPRRP